MTPPIKRIAITGGAGQIAYQLLFRIASGELFGKSQPIALHILELPEAMSALEGVAMELEDCAFPLLREIQLGSDPYQVFNDIDYAILVGAKPRGPGMERKDLLYENAKIFIAQGQALDKVASKNARILVVGNPCNTNCLIAMHHAPSLPKNNFYAMMRLDQNRMAALLAKRAIVDLSEVNHALIWGNHSSTQVPDIYNVRINGRPAIDTIEDARWLQGEFVESVQKRGAAIIAARGKSSAASAASAAIDSFRDIVNPTPAGQWYSLGVCSDGNPYHIESDLIFSFPCRTTAEGEVVVVGGIPWDDWLRHRIKSSETELIEERQAVIPLFTNATKG